MEKARYQWKVKEQKEAREIDQLRTVLNGINPALCTILLQRGIDSLEKAEAFFRPDLENLHDPMLMKDMDKASQRVIRALRNGEHITVLGDYDVDGTTSAAMMYLFLKSREANASFYIPDRYLEGYGISIRSIDQAVEKGSSLMICLDCGIKAIDKVAYANEKGLDMIICDHHRPGDEIPAAAAVLDPKREDCPYPFKELSGCGVGFKLIQGILQELDLPADEAYRYLDLLATSIAADIVPITGENRTLSFYGIRKVNMEPLVGIQALKESTAHKTEFRTSDLVFKLAPRINAAGRMSNGSKAVEIMVASDFEEAKKLAAEVNTFNFERGETDRQITEEAFEQAHHDPEFSKLKTSVFFGPNWHKGVIGIVASRMIEQFYRPTIIFCGDGEVLSGSARSVRHFDVYNALEKCEDLLIQFGGHKYAAGMTIQKENLPAFKKKFEQVVSETIGPESLEPVIDIDTDLDIAEIDRIFFNVLKRFAPFGPGNMNPVFRSRHALIASVHGVGQDKSHLKLQLASPNDPLKRLSAIAFSHGSMVEELSEGQLISVVYSIEENSWNGHTELQLNIKDVRV